MESSPTTETTPATADTSAPRKVLKYTLIDGWRFKATKYLE